MDTIALWEQEIQEENSHYFENLINEIDFLCESLYTIDTSVNILVENGMISIDEVDSSKPKELFTKAINKIKELWEAFKKKIKVLLEKISLSAMKKYKDAAIKTIREKLKKSTNEAAISEAEEEEKEIKYTTYEVKYKETSTGLLFPEKDMGIMEGVHTVGSGAALKIGMLKRPASNIHFILSKYDSDIKQSLLDNNNELTEKYLKDLERPIKASENYTIKEIDGEFHREDERFGKMTILSITASLEKLEELIDVSYKEIEKINAALKETYAVSDKFEAKVNEYVDKVGDNQSAYLKCHRMMLRAVTVETSKLVKLSNIYTKGFKSYCMQAKSL